MGRTGFFFGKLTFHANKTLQRHWRMGQVSAVTIC